MEQDEWKKIYQLYFKPLYLYALSLTHNAQDAEDLLQETFVKAFLSYKSTGSIKTWLIIVLKHEFLNVCRKRKREVLNGDTAYEEQKKQEMGKLPESAVIYLSVGEVSPRPVADIRKGDITLEWFQVNQPDSGFQGGISMKLNCIYKDTDDRTGMTEEELKKVYISNLQELLNTEYIWKDFGLSRYGRMFNYPKETLQNCLKDAEKISVLTTKKYCISGSKDQILNYLKNTDIKSIYVDKIRLSSLN